MDRLATIPFFEELDTFPLSVPQEASLQGYRTWDLPVPPFDFPADKAPPLRVGAQEETVFRANCSLASEVAERAGALQTQETPDLALPVRPRGFRSTPVCPPLHRYPETACDYSLRPGARPAPLGTAAQLAAAMSRVGSSSVVEAENTTCGAGATLCSAWLPPRGPGGSEVVSADGSPAPAPRLLDGPDPSVPAGPPAVAAETEADAEPAEPAEPDGEARPEAAPEDEFLAMVTALAAEATTFDSARGVAQRKVSRQSYAKRVEAAGLLSGRVAALQEKDPLLPLGMPYRQE
eukprot:SAG31_NODE_517_length_14689_cov_5.110487_12_plen_292_part_00